jgi:hypothetical protein
MVVLALILLLGMVIPIALILVAVAADALFVAWLGVVGANELWRKRLHPWVSAHLIHHRPGVIVNR